MMFYLTIYTMIFRLHLCYRVPWCDDQDNKVDSIRVIFPWFRITIRRNKTSLIYLLYTLYMPQIVIIIHTSVTTVKRPF